MDAFPLDVWLYKEPEELCAANKVGASLPEGEQEAASAAASAKMHLLVQIESIINVQVNHYQLLFLMRFLETLGEITCFLTQAGINILQFPGIIIREKLPEKLFPLKSFK